MSELLLRGLAITPGTPERLWSVSAQELVAAQRLCFRETILRGPRARRLPQVAMTLIPVGDGELLPDGPFDAIVEGAARDVDVMVGANVDEWNYFVFLVEPNKRTLDDAGLLKIYERRLPGRAQRAIDLYRKLLGPQLPLWRDLLRDRIRSHVPHSR